MISNIYEKIVGGSATAATYEPKIICVGLACLDIVHVCKHFPVEDSDERCVEYRWQRGGNASNNCTVLSKLGAPNEFLGTLGSEGHNWGFVKDDMKKHKIDYSHCPIIENVDCPMSTVILTLNGGSRTILHHNPNVPELKLEDVEKLNLENYSWIHFEGRNIPLVVSMMQYIETYNNKMKNNDAGHSEPPKSQKMPITMSVELEKKKDELLDLLPYADVAFISKDFARSRGYGNMSETLKNIGRDVKSGAVIVCAWGDRGAMARCPDGTIVQSPAFSPPKVVDTLGAGDTFTAAILFYLNTIKKAKKQIQLSSDDEAFLKLKNSAQSTQNEAAEILSASIAQNPNIESLERGKTEFIDRKVLQGAVTFACRIAGEKVGSRGYDGIERAPEDLFHDTLAQ